MKIRKPNCKPFYCPYCKAPDLDLIECKGDYTIVWDYYCKMCGKSGIVELDKPLDKPVFVNGKLNKELEIE